MKIKIEDLRWDDRGLVPAIVQDAHTCKVLMTAYMNIESLRRTIESGQTWFWSRSRNALWHKGETSGNTQSVVSIRVDCDADAILITVDPKGPACHTGEQTCFHNELASAGISDDAVISSALDLALDDLYSLLMSRYRERPAGSYTAQLFEEGLEKILAKVDEESQETIIAGRSETNQRLVEETSDLLYHLLVLLVQRGVTLTEIRAELARRRGARTK